MPGLCCKKTAVLFLSLIAAWGLNLQAWFRLEYKKPWTGLPGEQVRVLEAKALKDIRMVSSGKYIVETSLIRSGNNRGTWTDARGNVSILFNERIDIVRGSTFALACLFSEKIEAGGTPLLFAKAADVKPISPANTFYRTINLINKWLLGRLGLIGEGAGLLSALLLGVKEDLDPLEYKYFSRSGSLHILALSGMHLGIIAGFLRFFLKKFLPKARLNLAVTLLLFPYIALTGFPVSLVRAFLIFLALGLCGFFYRTPRGLYLLSFAFIVLSIISPESLTSLAAKLSFGALLGMILFSPRLSFWLRPPFPKPLGAGLSASLGAQAVTFPLIALSFGVYYPAGILSGLVLSILLIPFIWGGLFWIILAPLGAFLPQRLFISGMDLLYSLIIKTAELFSRFPAVYPRRETVFFYCAIMGLLSFTFFLYGFIKRWRFKG